MGNVINWMFGWMGGGKKESAPQPMPMPQAPKVEDAAGKAEEAMKAKRRAVGSQRTVYTSPLGIAGEANVARKTLLGQ